MWAHYYNPVQNSTCKSLNYLQVAAVDLPRKWKAWSWHEKDCLNWRPVFQLRMNLISTEMWKTAGSWSRFQSDTSTFFLLEIGSPRKVRYILKSVCYLNEKSPEMDFKQHCKMYWHCKQFLYCKGVEKQTVFSTPQISGKAICSLLSAHRRINFRSIDMRCFDKVTTYRNMPELHIDYAV